MRQRTLFYALFLLVFACPLSAQENSLLGESPPYVINGWINGVGISFGGELPGEVNGNHLYLVAVNFQRIRAFRERERGLLKRVDFVNSFNAGLTTSPSRGPVMGYTGTMRFHFDPLTIRPFRRTTLFLEVGGGGNYFAPHESVERITGAFQFAVVGGMGITYYPKRLPNRALVFGYASRHHSNLSALLPTPKPNQGVNTHELFFNIQFLPKR